MGPIPEGFHVHHRLPECGIAQCVNPAQLVAVGPREHTVLHEEAGMSDACRPDGPILLAMQEAGCLTEEGELLPEIAARVGEGIWATRKSSQNSRRAV